MPGNQYDSSLPIRSEADGLDERVLIKIQDGDDPGGANKTTEVSESLLHIRAFGQDPADTKVQLRLSEEGFANTQGDYDASTNTRPSSSGLIAHDRNAAPDETHQNKRLTAVAGADDTVCLDVALRDEAGQAYSATNPMPVSVEESEGAEEQNYTLFDGVGGSGIVKDETESQIIATAANGETLLVKRIQVSASGKIGALLQLGDGAASEVFADKGFRYNSTANPNCDFIFEYPLKIVGTVDTTNLQMEITNYDNNAFDASVVVVALRN